MTEPRSAADGIEPPIFASSGRDRSRRLEIARHCWRLISGLTTLAWVAVSGYLVWESTDKHNEVPQN
jgi:hypothetical protein